MYEAFEHTADLGLRVAAENLETLFADAARGLFSVIVANLDEVRPVQEQQVHVRGTAGLSAFRLAERVVVHVRN